MPYFFLFTLLGFVLGSTLFAYWIPKLLKNIDICTLPDDHNPGVSNAFMYGGFLCGILSLICELAKGFIPVYLGQKCLDISSLLFVPVLVAPVFGHAFPFYKNKKGGKAITASFGVLLGLFPELHPAVYLAFFFIFFSVVVIVNPHSLRSILTFGFFAFNVFLTIKTASIQIGCFIIAGIVIYRHLIRHNRTGKNKYSASTVIMVSAFTHWFCFLQICLFSYIYESALSNNICIVLSL